MICAIRSPCRELNVLASVTADGGAQSTEELLINRLNSHSNAQWRVTENFAVAHGVTPSTAGFRLAGQAAIKLHITIVSFAIEDGKLTTRIQELADRSGLSDRTVATALDELADLAWVCVNATRGQGVTVTLQTPPTKLTAAAQERYKDKIAKAYERLQRKAERTADILAEDARE